MKLGNDTIALVVEVATGQRDRLNNPVLKDVVTEHRWCLVTPDGSSEAEDQTVAKVTGLQLLAPRGVPVTYAKQVIFPFTKTVVGGEPVYSGPRYQVDGDVGDWGDTLQARLTKVG